MNTDIQRIAPCLAAILISACASGAIVATAGGRYSITRSEKFVIGALNPPITLVSDIVMKANAHCNELGREVVETEVEKLPSPEGIASLKYSFACK